MSLFSGENPALGALTTVDGAKVQNTLHVLVPIVAASVNTSVFIAPVGYNITVARVVYTHVGSTSAALNFEVVPSGTANGSGTTVLGTAFDLTATAATNYTSILSPVVSVPAGSRIATLLTGSLTGLTGGLLEITLVKV